MLRILVLAIALLAVPAAASQVDASHRQASESAAARVRWAVARQNSADLASDEDSCRAYGNQFFKAVEARQATSIREGGIERQRALEMLDAEIDAFNNLIASQCGSP